MQLRLLNHWDNLNGIDRARLRRPTRSGNGTSCPATISPRYADYARANASIGINGAVINNVNAERAHPVAGVPARRSPRSPTSGARTASACICRPTSPRPIRLGGLKTADPLDPGGRRLVEGEGRRDLQADSRLRRLPRQGELRRAAGPEGLRPHPRRRRQRAGRRAWRRTAATSSGARSSTTRTSIRIAPKRAYIEFTKLDGQFRPNVLVQVKNGAIDFMPREPFHPLFGALKQDAGPRRDSGHAGVSRPGQAPRLSRHDVEGVSRRGHLREGQGLDRRQGRSRARCIPYRVTGMVSVLNPGLDTQLVRPSLLAVELVRVRPARVEPGARRAARSPTSGRA